jgi:hypothetical protein
LALRINDTIPNETLDRGFEFGSCLYGNSKFEVIHFVIDFQGFKTYNLFVNPNSPVVQTVINMMIESKDYFFLLLNGQNSVTAFRSEINDYALTGLKDNLLRVKNSNATNAEYEECLSGFIKNPQSKGEMLSWICRYDMRCFDLTKDRFELNPC